MSSQHKYQDSNISIMDAVETLSNIADMEVDKQIGITQEHELFLQDQQATYKTVHWLNQQDIESTINLVKTIFKVIFDYFRYYYKENSSFAQDTQTTEGIKNIMVLVGE